MEVADFNPFMLAQVEVGEAWSGQFEVSNQGPEVYFATNARISTTKF